MFLVSCSTDKMVTYASLQKRSSWIVLDLSSETVTREGFQRFSINFSQKITHLDLDAAILPGLANSLQRLLDLYGGQLCPGLTVPF